MARVRRRAGPEPVRLAHCTASGRTRQPHAIADNSGDQAFFEWLLGYGVYTLGHGADPFFTDLLNAPLGVNLAVNTSITVYTVLLAPITWAFGPSISYLTILTLNLAGAAFAWYAFLGRFVVRHRAAAALAGMFCGFAPGFVSHANGHLNWSAGWVAPVLLWWVLKLREPDHRLRNGLVLGLLVTVGFSIAAEGLFFTALACGVFLTTWSLAPSTRAEARAALPAVATALAVTAVVAGTLLAYPLWMHFAGPADVQRHRLQPAQLRRGHRRLPAVSRGARSPGRSGWTPTWLPTRPRKRPSSACRCWCSWSPHW